jgi:hypothetical protein
MQKTFIKNMLKLSPQFYIYTFQFNHTVSEFQLIADCFARLYKCNQRAFPLCYNND